MLFKNNKFYEDLVATEKEKENMISECFKILDNESLAPDDEISLRRNEKMKKKEYGDAVKKVAVASLSLIATGAIVIGVSSYKNNKHRSVVAKNESVTAIETTLKNEMEETTDTSLDKDECIIELTVSGQEDTYGYMDEEDNIDILLFECTDEELESVYKKADPEKIFDELKNNYGSCYMNKKILKLSKNSEEQIVLTFKGTKEEKEKIEKHIEKYGHRYISLRPGSVRE